MAVGTGGPTQNRLSAFAVDSTGSLWERPFTAGGPYWGHWVNHGQPPNTTAIGSAAGATTVGGYFSGWVIGANGHLFERYLSNGQWFWTDHGTPPGTTASSAPAAVSNSNGDVYVFVTAKNGHVELRQYTGPTGWVWHDLGSPGAGIMTGRPAPTILYDRGQPEVQATVRSTTGHLFDVRQSGASWAYTDHGLPLGTAVASDPGDAPWSGQAKAFVTSSNGQLWQLSFGPGSVDSWFDLGLAAGSSASGSPSAVQGRPTVIGDIAYPSLYVYVDNGAGHLVDFDYTYALAKHDWSWSSNDDGTPIPEAGVASPPTAVFTSWGFLGAYAIGGNHHLYEEQGVGPGFDDQSPL
jgi:hypothetical protein